MPQAAVQLSSAPDPYSLLEARVSELTGELAVVSAQRMAELAEKERLANRLQHLLDLLPGGIIVIDDRGRVREANPAACELLGLPLEGVGLLLAIDPILDMGRTATNVAGQALVPTLVAKQQGMLDMDVYNAASGDLPTEPDQTTQRAA